MPGDDLKYIIHRTLYERNIQIINIQDKNKDKLITTFLEVDFNKAVELIKQNNKLIVPHLENTPDINNDIIKNGLKAINESTKSSNVIENDIKGSAIHKKLFKSTVVGGAPPSTPKNFPVDGGGNPVKINIEGYSNKNLEIRGGLKGKPIDKEDIRTRENIGELLVSTIS